MVLWNGKRVTPREVWLRPNRRALAVFACSSAALAGGLGWGLWVSPNTIISILLAVAAVPVTWLLAVLVYALFQPRLAYREGQLLVYLRSGGPVRIPIEIVECFFLGRGHLPPAVFSGQERQVETSTVVVRLAEAAKEWSHGEVLPALGQWCDGYITIRGTWCEPLSGELVKQLNHRLAEVRRTTRQQTLRV